MVLRNSDRGLQSPRQGCAPVEAGNSGWVAMTPSSGLLFHLGKFGTVLPDSDKLPQHFTLCLSQVLYKQRKSVAPEELFVTQQDLKCCLYKKLMLSLQQNRTCPENPQVPDCSGDSSYIKKWNTLGEFFCVWCSGRATHSCWFCASDPSLLLSSYLFFKIL